LFASLAASLIDSALFWSLGFWEAPVPWITWAFGDFLVKLVLDFALLTPFRLATSAKNQVFMP
ncbi:MAG TPA: hypothetical protein VFO37_12575, partial [Chitinophagaceae bacterium]|nr:hypothetical protein [Chitinophagaceae bacterium]